MNDCNDPEHAMLVEALFNGDAKVQVELARLRERLREAEAKLAAHSSDCHLIVAKLREAEVRVAEHSSCASMLARQCDAAREAEAACAAILASLADEFGRAAHEYHIQGSRAGREGKSLEATVQCAMETVAGTCEHAVRAYQARSDAGKALLAEVAALRRVEQVARTTRRHADFCNAGQYEHHDPRPPEARLRITGPCDCGSDDLASALAALDAARGGRG